MQIEESEKDNRNVFKKTVKENSNQLPIEDTGKFLELEDEAALIKKIVDI